MGKPIVVGPFGSVNDAADPGAKGPTRLAEMRNAYIPDPENGSAALQRHGFAASTSQLGAGDVRRGQGMLNHRRLDGTLDRFTWGGGRMYRWDGAVTYADITPAGILLDPANPVFAITFNDRVVVSDEQNKPWVYNPDLATAATIPYNALDEEWNTKGGPILYSGRVVFIVKRVGDRALEEEPAEDLLLTEDNLILGTEAQAGFQNTITWSAALNALVGYQQANYDNNWTLTSSSSDLLAALFADEGALTYLRNTGIGYITGAIVDDFRTSATTDAIDTTIGTDAPAALVVVNRIAWFLDMDGRVHRMSATAKPEELWRAMRRTVEANVGTVNCRANVVRYGRAAYHPGLKLVLFTIWDDTTLYCFDARTGAYFGTWAVLFGCHVTAMGSLTDINNRATFLALGTIDIEDTASLHGFIWKQKFPSDPNPWLDSISTAVFRFECAIETHWLDYKGALVFRALRAVASMVGGAARASVGMSYTRPSAGRSAPLYALQSAVVGGATGEPSIASARFSFGRNAQGSALRFRVTSESDEQQQFGVHQVEIDVQTVQARAGAK